MYACSIVELRHNVITRNSLEKLIGGEWIIVFYNQGVRYIRVRYNEVLLVYMDRNL
jgi:hypothetical protein